MGEAKQITTILSKSINSGKWMATSMVVQKVFGVAGFLAILYAVLFWLLGRFFPNGPRSTVELIFSEVWSGWRS